MSNNPTGPNSNDNEMYSGRQRQSSFQPFDNTHFQPTMLSPAQEQQMLYDQFQSLQLAQQQQQQSQYYGNQMIPPLPLNMGMPMMSPHYIQQSPELQPQQQQQEFNHSNFSYQPYSSIVPSPVTNVHNATSNMRFDAPAFSPSSKTTTTTTTTSSNETRTTTNQPILLRNNSEPKTTTTATDSFIYDLKKYKYDYFLSTLTCDFNPAYAKFGSPTGICTLNDDRLLVANFDRDSLLLMDIHGVVYQIYQKLLQPKDVRYVSTNPSHAVVATRKEIAILDLNTSQIVVTSKLRGFYPWNVQYLPDNDVFAACDPSGERIVFFDKNLVDIGGWSFNEQLQPSSQSQVYQKTYPYASYFLQDNTSFVLTHRETECRLEEKISDSGEKKANRTIPPELKSFSIYVDAARKCLIPDKANRRLVSVDKDSTVEIFKCKSIQEPHSLTFLSTGTLCVTDWKVSPGIPGGLAILSETDLKQNP